MRIIEEQILKSSIVQFNKYYKGNEDVKNFYKNINTLDIKSLQKSSINRDEKFFKEVSFIMSVIYSIIAHPHKSNKGEEIILRSVKANNISEEDFQKTLKDPMLWKQQNYKMIPEYVHHHQYTDELNIYENAFIVLLIDLLDKELTQYTNYYVNLLPSIALEVTEIIDDEQVLRLLKKVNMLSTRFQFIKNTQFYKEIHRHPKISKAIKPTNILLKDRLYNYCFKFYRKFIQYEDIFEISKDFRIYYSLLILKELKNQGFKLTTLKSNQINLKENVFNIKLIKDEFNLIMYFDKMNQIIFDCSIKGSDKHFIHRIICNPNEKNEEEFKKELEVVDNKVITIWNVYNENNELINKNVLKESELAKIIIDDLFIEVVANKEVYSQYCPICKSKNLDEDHSYYRCLDCMALYTFKKSLNKDKIWLINARR